MTDEPRHAHVFTVLGMNDDLGAFAFLKPTDKAGRPYYWRVSECRLPDCPSAASGGAVHSEGSFEPFPPYPKVGERLKLDDRVADSKQAFEDA